MNNIDLMNYWIKSADEDFVTMEILYKNKQNCTNEYTAKQIENIKEIREWLKNLLMVE